MREIKTMDMDRVVPSEQTGYVKITGMMKPEEAFQMLKDHLTEVNLLPDEYFQASSYSWPDNLKDCYFAEARSSVNWGGNEGIYMDVSLLYREPGNTHDLKEVPFATGKTLDRSGEAFLKMSQIAAECSMMLNGGGSIVKVPDLFYEPELEKQNQKILESKDINDSLKDWYIIKYSSDELGVKLPETLTFKDVLSEMMSGHDFYSVLGVSDSLVRERIFEELSSRMHVEYDVIYDIWLKTDKENPVIDENKKPSIDFMIHHAADKQEHHSMKHPDVDKNLDFQM